MGVQESVELLSSWDELTFSLSSQSQLYEVAEAGGGGSGRVGGDNGGERSSR